MSSQRHFATYFDSGYVARGLTLHASLVAQQVDAVLHVLCLDDAAHDRISGLNDPTVRPWRLAELEAHDPQLAAVRGTRSRVEYYFTAGPSFLQLLLDLLPEIQDITYLDSDMMFFRDPEIVFAEAPDASVLLVEHRFPPRLMDHAERFGRFNVAWVTFRRTGPGLACLAHWREKCLEWCYDRVEPDRFADQKYLDEFPALFDGVHIIQHLGADAAPWNVERAPIELADGAFRAGGQPLVFFHFHDLRRVGWGAYDLNFRQYGTRPSRAIKHLYHRYLTALLAQGAGDLASARRARLNIAGYVRRVRDALRHRDLLWHARWPVREGPVSAARGL